MGTIYFDNAATSWPKPDAMIKAMIDFNAGTGANPGRSGHRLSIDAGRIIFNAREAAAELIGAGDPLSVVFTRNATEGLNTAVNGLLQPGDHAITSGMEHNSVMRPLRALEQRGVELSIIKCSGNGELSPDDVSTAIKKNTRLIITTHASNVVGTIMPVADIGRIARENNIIYCVDAAQTAGSIPINVEQYNIDILVFTGHKSLYGPQGTGGFYIRDDVVKELPPFERGGTGSKSELEEQPDFMPDKYESGTPNTIGLAGLNAGINYITDYGIEKIREKEINLAQNFIDGLKNIKDVEIYGSKDASKRTAVVSFNIRGMSPSDVSFELDERYSIMSRPGLHCAPAAHKTIGTLPQGTVRFSFGLFSTINEINTALDAIAALSAENRK